MNEPIQAMPISTYSAEDQAFFKLWYQHMQGDIMTGQLADVQHSTARYIWDAARRAAPADVGEDGLPELPPMNVAYADHSYPAYNSAAMRQAQREAREYQRKVDERIIARRDAEIADLRAQLAARGQGDGAEPGHTESLADRVFNLPCNWRGDHALRSAVLLGHTMACEQAYNLVMAESSQPVAWMKPDEIAGLLQVANEDVPTRHYGRVYAQQYDADMVPVWSATPQPAALHPQAEGGGNG